MIRLRPFAALTADPALRPFAELIAAANEGRAPDPAAVASIAVAAPMLFNEGPVRERFAAFARALGVDLRVGKGRRADDAAADVMARAVIVGEVILRERELRASMPERAAGAQAARETASAHHRSLRSVQAWRADPLVRERAEELIDATEQENTRSRKQSGG